MDGGNEGQAGGHGIVPDHRVGLVRLSAVQNLMSTNGNMSLVVRVNSARIWPRRATSCIDSISSLMQSARRIAKQNLSDREKSPHLHYKRA
jgi:hypothetical protein